MRLEPDPLERGVRVFRAATASASDGAATRARVLEGAERRLIRRARWRRVGVGSAVLLGVLSFGSAAWTALGSWRAGRAVAPAALQSPPGAAAPPRPAAPPEAVPPPPLEIPTPPRGEPEADVYARAHEAHFERDAPAAALAAWNRYLRAFPSGVFVPDARYNRALCLLRLGRLAEAARALRPFASGAFHGYRRVEAEALVDWIQRHAATADGP